MGKLNSNFKIHCAFEHTNILCIQTKGVHPRHPPRAFPLGLRVPRCLCAGKQEVKRLKYQEMSRLEFARSFLGRGSLLSPGWALLDYEESALAIPSLRFSILCLVCSFRFRFSIAIRVRHSSFSRGHPSGNARGGCKCTYFEAYLNIIF